MQLTDEKHYYGIDDFFSFSTTAGFTKPGLENKALEEFKKISRLNQLHSSKVNFIKTEGTYRGDGLFSQEKNLALIVKTADCLPLFFASEKLGVIGIVHMGWRGAKEGILNNINYDLSSFKVIAGVGMRECCYEVGEEFFDYFEIAGYLKKRGDKLRFDPVSFAKDKLRVKGLEEENFLDLKICGFCSDKGFFSYRKTKTASRTFSFILRK